MFEKFLYLTKLLILEVFAFSDGTFLISGLIEMVLINILAEIGKIYGSYMNNFFLNC